MNEKMSERLHEYNFEGHLDDVEAMKECRDKLSDGAAQWFSYEDVFG